MSYLKDKVIVIDPGHGGDASGAIGPTGLMEKDVNLKVAFYLRDLLRPTGAKVILTRDADFDVPLGDRVKIAEENRADIFISIHHNANSARDTSINRTEIYCKYEFSSPSFDFAYILMRKFKEKFGLPVIPPLPAMYRVLKNPTPVSVLGEASYIINPEEEARLRTEEYQKLEASIYFEALLEYAERGFPRVEGLEIDKNGNIKATLNSDFTVDFDTVDLNLDGISLEFDVSRETNILNAALPENISNGEHKLSLSFRNIRGNISPRAVKTFKIQRPVSSFSITTFPEKTDGLALVTFSFFDALGIPVAEGTRVYIKLKEGRVLHEEKYVDKDGKLRVVVDLKHPEIYIYSDNFEGRGMVILSRKDEIVVTKVVNELTGKPVEGVRAEFKDGKVEYSNFGGFIFLKKDRLRKLPCRLSKEGYYDKKVLSHKDEVRIKPKFGGVLLDKKIIIDPQYGGFEKGLIKEPYHESLINLKFAYDLKKMLELGGAEVLLTRYDDETTIDEVERVKFIMKEAPDLLITVSHHNPYLVDDGGAFHYYRDAVSRELAEKAVRYLKDVLDLDKVKLADWSSYLMIHPKPPRIYVVPRNMKKYNIRHLTELKKEALAVFLAILDFFGFKKFRVRKGIAEKDGEILTNYPVVSATGIRTFSDQNGSYVIALFEGEKNPLENG